MKLLIILLVGMVLLCSPKVVIEERSYGLKEPIVEDNYKVIKLDTVKYGEGYLKRATIKRRVK